MILPYREKEKFFSKGRPPAAGIRAMEMHLVRRPVKGGPARQQPA